MIKPADRGGPKAGLKEGDIHLLEWMEKKGTSTVAGIFKKLVASENGNLEIKVESGSIYEMGKSFEKLIKLTFKRNLAEITDGEKKGNSEDMEFWKE